MKNYFLILLSFLLISCNFNTVHENREEDKKDAEKTVQTFYNLLEKENKDALFKLMSKEFTGSTPKEKFDKIIDATLKDCGKVINDSLVQWQTLTVEGTNPKSEYILVYKVKRSIKNTNERFIMKKEGDLIKVLRYNINFDY